MVNVNSSLPQVVQELQAVKVYFNETLFNNSSVRVIFSSNCADSEAVNYSNPILMNIPDTWFNSGQCHYFIQLVDSNSQPVGYPITGHVEVGGKICS